MAICERRRRKANIIVPLASMGDIAFLLIIFFILTTNFVKEQDKQIEIASSNDIETINLCTGEIYACQGTPITTLPTECPVVATECPVITTQCPPIATACPAATTQCPPIATVCPAATYKTNGTACDDNNGRTSNDVCTDGVCKGT